LVYDVTSETSFKNLNSWYNSVKENGLPSTSKYFINSFQLFVLLGIKLI